MNYTYDHAGRLTNDGTNTYTWDGANRLLSVGSTSYLYNGTGQRMQQTVSGTVTQYVLDTQPGLAKVLQSTTGSNITRYVHGPMGIQEQQNPDATWRHPIQDGLGSVRTVVDTTNTPQESRWYDPFGTEIQQSGTQQTVFGFTGEETDSIGLVNLRARYYNPAMGQFLSLDPLEGRIGRPLSLNRYSYVQNNVINSSDPSGLVGSLAACPAYMTDAVEMGLDEAEALNLIPEQEKVAIEPVVKAVACSVYQTGDEFVQDADLIGTTVEVTGYVAKAVSLATGLSIATILSGGALLGGFGLLLYLAGQMPQKGYTIFELSSMSEPVAPQPKYSPQQKGTQAAPAQQPKLSAAPTPPNNCNNDNQNTNIVRVRHYSADINGIKRSMVIGGLSAQISSNVFVQYPYILTPRIESALVAQYVAFGRPAGRLTGIVEFNVDRNKWVMIPDAWLGHDAWEITLRLIQEPSNYTYLMQGFPLSDSGVAPEFYDRTGQSIP